MFQRFFVSTGILLCAAMMGAWIQNSIPERVCMTKSTCKDYAGLPSPCAVTVYDVDGDGCPDVTCTKCAPLPTNKNPLFTCEPFEEVECTIRPAGANCNGFVLVSPCSGGVCLGVWSATADPCQFGVPDCDH